MKIIYVYERRHCYNYDESMFQYYTFKDKGYELEVWSIVNWTFVDIEFPKNGDKSDYCHYINNKADLIQELNRVNKDNCYFLIYPYHNYNYISYLMRKEIKKHGFKFSNITESVEISLNNCKFPLEINIMYVINQVIFYLVHIVYNTLFVFRKGKFKKLRDLVIAFFGPFIISSDRNFVTTKILFYSYPNILEAFSKKNKLIHSISYDETLLIDKSKLINCKYVLFIDQFLTGHSDFLKSGLNYPISNKEEYFSQLCNLFDKIERDYKCEVIIAAHPKAEYKGDEFNNRRIIVKQTKELVFNSEFCILQTSTVLGVIAQLKKTFINIFSKEMFINTPEFKNYYVAINRVFHNKQLDISNEENISNYKNYFVTPNQFYDDYINRYVISNKENNSKLFYEEVYKELFSKNLIQIGEQ